MNHLEECVIGSILCDNKCFPDVLKTGLSAKYFSPAGADVFRVVSNLYECNEPIDAATLGHALINDGGFDSRDDAALVITPCLEVPNAAHAAYYATKVIEGWKDRQLRYLGQSNVLDTSAGSVDQRISKIRQVLEELAAAPCGSHTEIMSADNLFDEYPELSPVLVDGLIRRGETANIISMTKIGKSWLIYDLALSIATGRPWCGCFGTEQGRVLLIDNELHPSTLSNRIKSVASAMGLASPDYVDRFDIWSMRGRLRDIRSIRSQIESIRPGHYSLVIVDAWYRMIPIGVSENANAEMAQLSNCVDAYAEKTGAAWALIHHSTKGEQGDKRVTDVGSGAGSMARAADSHIVLREHEEAEHFVMSAAVRSFPPLEPVTLRWEFPMWHFVDGVTPRLANPLKKRQTARDNDGINQIRQVLGTDESWLSVRAIRTATGMGLERTEKLLGIMGRDGDVISQPGTYQNKPTVEYQLAKPP